MELGVGRYATNVIGKPAKECFKKRHFCVTGCVESGAFSVKTGDSQEGVSKRKVNISI